LAKIKANKRYKNKKDEGISSKFPEMKLCARFFVFIKKNQLDLLFSEHLQISIPYFWPPFKRRQ
jgi:hypothetical protein